MTRLDQIPVRLCCGQRHWGAVCPDGRVMCQLCYERVAQKDLHVDTEGQRWDVCSQCQALKAQEQQCHICGKRRDEPGETYCSAAHPLDPEQQP